MTPKQLIIYLHPNAGTLASWITTDENNQIIDSVYNGDLSQFPIDTADYTTTLIVPAEHVLLSYAELPKLSRQRLFQALPFALEDQLIDDVAELHFAIGSFQPNGTWPVAIVSKTKMAEWLHLCEEIQVTPDAFIPSIYLLPHAEKTWQVNIDQTHSLVRIDAYTGFACEKENLDLLLDLRLNEEADKALITINQTEEKEQTLLEKTFLNPSQPFINLLQGTYQPKPKGTETKKIWVLTGYLALALIALGFFSNIMSYFLLNHQNKKIELQIATIYKKNFPHAKAIVAPRERMQEKLRAASGLSTKNAVLILLGQVGKALTEAPGVHIQHLEYKEHQLVLNLTATDFANLDKFTASLVKENLNVKQQNAETHGNAVQATLLIKQGGP